MIALASVQAPADAPPAEVEPEAAAPAARPRFGQLLLRSPLTLALAGLAAFSAVTLFFGVYAYFFSALQEQRSQQQLYAEFRGLLDPSSQVAPSIGGVITPGTPVAMLNSPQAGLHNLIVVEGTSSDELLAGPGHLRDTPLPGQVGESVLIGRSDTAGAPFAGVTSLRKGDVISVTTGQGTFRYLVAGKFSAGESLPSVSSTGSLLTLVTSSGSGALGSLVPSSLVYVEATLDGKTVTAPAGRPTLVAPDETAGQGDPSAWIFVVLWLQALLVASVGAVWLWSRWGWLRTWLLGAPVIFAVLWGLSTEALRLLPNVY